MPEYAFDCEHCGSFRFNAPVMHAGPCECPVCGSDDCVKVFEASKALIVPAWMQAQNLSANANQKEWADSPEVKKQRDAGIYASPDDSKKVGEQLYGKPEEIPSADVVFEQLMKEDPQNLLR